MGLFDRFKNKEVEAPRTLDHPRDLLVGDMIDFSLVSQTELSNKSFQVTNIWTLDLGGDNKKRIYFQLGNADLNIRLRIVNDDMLELGLEVYPEQLLSLFSQADLENILDPDSGVNHQLKIKGKLKNLAEEFTGWVTKKYHQEGFELAYRYDDDYRDKSLPETLEGNESGCDFAWLISEDREYAIEFRVFDGGRTEAHLCVYLPLRKIESLWPAKQD